MASARPLSRLKTGKGQGSRLLPQWYAEALKRRGAATFYLYQHHREVAALPPSEADALLDWCEETRNRRIFAREKTAADHRGGHNQQRAQTTIRFQRAKYIGSATMSAPAACRN
jgi:hypothetical protein